LDGSLYKQGHTGKKCKERPVLPYILHDSTESSPNNTFRIYSHSCKTFFAVFVIPKVLTLVTTEDWHCL